MARFTLFISILISILSCSEINTSPENNIQIFENFYDSDTLTIQAQIGDCGEWGGHIERMDIYLKDDNKLTLHFQKDTVNCPNPSKFNRRIIENWTKELSVDDQIHIEAFIHNLTSMTFKDEEISNGGNHYFIKRSTGGLALSYSNYDYKWIGFKELKKKITTANKNYKQ